MVTFPVTACLLGAALGMRHAFEPDHLAAVSTLVIEEGGAHRAALLGAFWGIGHSAALLGVGVLLAGIEARMPEQLSAVFELGVAAMLVALGVRALHQALRGGRGGAVTRHAHGGIVHAHAAPVGHLHLGRWTLASRPFVVGLLHGLAGSGSLTTLVVANLPSPGARLLYVALFGLGSIVGMAVLSGCAGWPLRTLSRHPRVRRGVGAAAGLVSLLVGVAWGYPLVAQLPG